MPPSRLLLLSILLSLAAGPAPTRLIAVREQQGTLHGFLVLRDASGSTVGYGDLIQTVAGDRVTCRTTFHLKNGSLNDESAVFSQHGTFRLLSDHLVQRGPSFDYPLTMDIDVGRGHVVVRSTSADGKEQVDDKRMDLPPNLANGIIIALLENIDPDKTPVTFGYVAATPAPRLVTLVVSNAGPSRFSIGDSVRTATDFAVKTDIGGLPGLIAPIIGKQPPDSHVWIFGGDAPAFVKSETPLAPGGPMMRMELTNPAW
jgi:hypothetical protein